MLSHLEETEGAENIQSARLWTILNLTLIYEQIPTRALLQRCCWSVCWTSLFYIICAPLKNKLVITLVDSPLSICFDLSNSPYSPDSQTYKSLLVSLLSWLTRIKLLTFTLGLILVFLLSSLSILSMICSTSRFHLHSVCRYLLNVSFLSHMLNSKPTLITSRPINSTCPRAELIIFPFKLFFWLLCFA